MYSPNRNVAALIIVAFLFVVQVSTLHSIYPRITNGQNTFRSQFTFMASMQLGYPPGFFFKHECCGIIYNTYWIYTVATCVQKMSGRLSARIKVGKHYTEKDDDSVQVHKIAHRIIHEQYNGSLYYDVGLLGTEKEIQLTLYVGIANLHQQPDLPTNEFVMVGWGYITQVPKAKKPLVLQKATVRVLEHSECIRYLFYYNPRVELQDSHVCTHTPLRAVAACPGDTGGALLHYTNRGYTVVGLISGISPFCDILGVPTISTLLSRFKHWADLEIANFPKKSSVQI